MVIINQLTITRVRGGRRLSDCFVSLQQNYWRLCNSHSSKQCTLLHAKPYYPCIDRPKSKTKTWKLQVGANHIPIWFGALLDACEVMAIDMYIYIYISFEKVFIVHAWGNKVCLTITLSFEKKTKDVPWLYSISFLLFFFLPISYSLYVI